MSSAKPQSTQDLNALARIQRSKVREIVDNLIATQLPPPSVQALRMRAAIFGHNAPKFEDSLQIPADVKKWVKETLERAEKNLDEYDPTYIYLDTVYPSIVKDSWVVLRTVLKAGPTAIAYQVDEVAEISKSDFTLSAKVTRLKLKSRKGLEKFNIRETTVFAQSEELALARQPIEKPVKDKEIELDTWDAGLFTGQRIIICGERHDKRGVFACELATIDKVEHILETEGFTRITLKDSLKNAYVRGTVTINGNVAPATHGEAIQGGPGGHEEVLGSGDAGQAFQRFTLRQAPLTYVSASTPSGAQTTLEVRVNDLLWQEVPTFYGRSPEERIYVTRTDNDGKTTVMFGDGKTGARLPTGQENVRAKYRKGIGLAGLVKDTQLSQLMTRPLGVSGVTNPLPPSGAADPENLAEARRNAPLTVLTLERIVSLQDYEDFARAFAGIDKALATWTWVGEKRGVFVTVAGAKGAEVKSDSALYKNLLTAMRKAGDPTVPLLVQSYELELFRLSAAVKVDPDYLPEKVSAAVAQQLRSSFSFEARAFGQPVHLSEVIAVMQNVRGVTAVDVKEFYRFGQTPGLNLRLEAKRPQPGPNGMLAAQLLTLDPGFLSLEVMP